MTKFAKFCTFCAKVGKEHAHGKEHARTARAKAPRTAHGKEHPVHALMALSSTSEDVLDFAKHKRQK